MKKKNKKPKSGRNQADAKKSTTPEKEIIDLEDSSPKAKSSEPDKTSNPANIETSPVENPHPGDIVKTPAKKEESVLEIAESASIGQKQTFKEQSEAGLEPEEPQVLEPPKEESKPTTDAEDKVPAEQKKSAFRFVGLFLFLLIIGSAIVFFKLTIKEKKPLDSQKPPVTEEKTFVLPKEPKPSLLPEVTKAPESILEESATHEQESSELPPEKQELPAEETQSEDIDDSEIVMAPEKGTSVSETSDEATEETADTTEEIEIAEAPAADLIEETHTQDEPADEESSELPEDEVDDSEVTHAPLEAGEENKQFEETTHAEDQVAEEAEPAPAVSEIHEEPANEIITAESHEEEPVEEQVVDKAEHETVLSEAHEKPAKEIATTESHEEEPIEIDEAVEVAPDKTQPANEKLTVERSKGVRDYLDFIESSARKVFELIDLILDKFRAFL